MKYALKRTYRAEASGGKLYSFLNAMHKNGIFCQKERCRGNKLCFLIAAKHWKTASELARTYGVTLQSEEKRSLFRTLYRYRFRFGIPIGILLAGALFFYCSNIVMRIEVIGSTSDSETRQILTILEEQGVARGSWIPEIDFSKCEHQLRAAVDELAWVGMRHTGNRLVVEVMARTPTPEMLETRVPCNLVAAQDAQITAVSIYCGQLMRLVGDPVRKGELLVSGVITDETGHTGVRHAMGSITGIYTQEQVFTCAAEDEIRTPTGQTETQRYLDLFAWHIPLCTRDVSFSDSVKTTEHHWFSLFGAELPVGIYQEHFQAYETTVKTYTTAEMQQNLKEQEQRYADNFLDQVEVLDKKITVLEKEDGIDWVVSYTLEGEIAVQQELFLHDAPVPFQPAETTETTE